MLIKENYLFTEFVFFFFLPLLLCHSLMALVGFESRACVCVCGGKLPSKLRRLKKIHFLWAPK